MERKNGPWTIKETESKYKDEFLELFVDHVLQPDGEPSTYAIVQLKRGVAILPMDDDGHVYLTRQFRYPIEKESMEVISGGAEEGEGLLEAAKREAKEELGIEGEEWKEMGYFHLETSVVKGPVYLFTVSNIEFKERDPDSTEDIKKIKLTLKEAVQKVLANEITHGPSCLLILKTYLASKGGKQ